jgi:acyl carrier protein
MADTRTRLIQCFSAVFSGLDERDIERASRTSVEGWDSLANFSLITVIEEEFDIQVAPDDVDKFTAFGVILDYLRQRDGEGA